MKQIESMSERDLVEIIERASTIDERLGDDFVPAESGDAALAERRLETWSQALGKGDWDRLRRRLAWDGLDPESVRPALGPVCLREGVPLPEWSKLLAEALRLAPTERQEDEAWPTEMGFLDAEDALPFEEVLAPFVLVARERLAGRMAAFGNLLSAPARAALERSLLRSLSYVSDEILLTEFETMRGREQSSWDRLFALAQEPLGRSLYRQFVHRLGEGRMARLLKQYPVLARHMGTISQLWVEAGAEFLGRLEADMSELERLFGDDEELGNVVELKPSLSDPHRGGRSVIALTFASGRKLVYKPKDMGTEAAYHRLLAWLNERGAASLQGASRARPLHARLGGVRGASAMPGSGRGQALLRAGRHAALPVLRARGHGLPLREHYRERGVPRADRHGDVDAPPRPCGGPW